METEGVPLLLREADAMRLVGVKNRSSWRLMMDRGGLPAPVRLGRALYWRRDELIAWVTAGCPGRRVWETHALNAFSPVGGVG